MILKHIKVEKHCLTICITSALVIVNYATKTLLLSHELLKATIIIPFFFQIGETSIKLNFVEL